MGVSEEFSTRGLQTNFAAVASHPAATRSFSLLARTIVIIHTVVVLTQHRQVRGFGVSAVFMGVDVVDLASIGRDVAVWPWTHEVLCHGEGAELVGCEPCFIEVDRPGGGVEEPDVELVAQATFHRGVDEFGARHGRAIG